MAVHGTHLMEDIMISAKMNNEAYDPRREYALEELKSQGLIEDAWDAVSLFESAIAEYTGSKFAIAIDNCTDALYLCLKYLKCDSSDVITIPKKTYCSIPMLIHNAGCNYEFGDISWSGCYQLSPLPVYDYALRLRKGMYKEGTFQCLSFHRKKILKLTKGGMILTDNEEAANWFKAMRAKGRHPHEKTFYTDESFEVMGWNMYMHPEDAAKGYLIFKQLPDFNEDAGGDTSYIDLSKQEIFIKNEKCLLIRNK
jgi:dTDP-4-amino-4,6-dideoxygalactose transaminase